MEFGWVFLSLFAAFGHAFGLALRKKVLRVKGVGNLLGFVSFLATAGLCYLIWFTLGSGVLPSLSQTFYVFASLAILANLAAVLSTHKALEHADLSLLVPFTSLSALLVVLSEYLISDVILQQLQLVGVAFVALGAFLVVLKKFPDKKTYVALGYYSITIISISVLSVFLKIIVDETGDPVFVVATVNSGVAVGFILLMAFEKKLNAFSMLTRKGGLKLLGVMIALGATVALINKLPTNFAYEQASAGEVIAVKRIMPFFGLILGIVMFKEKVTLRHAIGTALLVGGCMLVVWFQ